MARMSKKRREEIRKSRESLPDLFDLGIEEEVPPEDEILDLRMEPIYFILMVADPSFTLVKPGTKLSYGEYLKSEVRRTGEVLEDGRIRLLDLDPPRVVDSLTHMGGAYSPENHGHLRKTEVGRSRPAPNGWERIWVVLDSMGTSRIIKDVFMDNFQDLGFTIEQLKDVAGLYGEMHRRGMGDMVDTPFMQSQLKLWLGRQKGSTKGKDKTPE